MAKGFPYFKFIASEWLTGDIVFEDYDLQGIFINVCALYWHRDGDISLEDLKKRIKTDRLNSLLGRFIDVDNDGNISIKFLKEQLVFSGYISETNSKNGKLGGRPKGAKNKEKKPTAKRPKTDRKAEKSKEDIEREIQEEKIKAERFENFWKFYNKGSKKNAKTQFMKLSLEDIDKMSFHVVKYFKANPEKKYRKDAERYISHRLFETEIDLPQQTLPENWWNMDLTPEQWKLVPEDKVQEKKRHDIRRQMGI